MGQNSNGSIARAYNLKSLEPKPFEGGKTYLIFVISWTSGPSQGRDQESVFQASTLENMTATLASSRTDAITLKGSAELVTEFFSKYFFLRAQADGWHDI